MVVNSPSVRSGLGRTRGRPIPSRVPLGTSLAPLRRPTYRPVRLASPPIVRRVPSFARLGATGLVAATGLIVVGLALYTRLSVNPDSDPRFVRSGNRYYFTGASWPGTATQRCYELDSIYLQPNIHGVRSHPDAWDTVPNNQAYFRSGLTSWQSIYPFREFREHHPGCPYTVRYEWAFDVPPYYAGGTIPGATVWWIPPELPLWHPLAPPQVRPLPRPAPGRLRPPPRPGRENFIVRPGRGPHVVVDLTPDGRAIVKRGRASSREPPGFGGRKVRSRVLPLLVRAMDRLSEAAEFFDILFDAADIPEGIPFVQALRMFFLEGYHENVTLDEFWEFYHNVSQDRAWGQFYGDLAAVWADLTGGSYHGGLF